MPRRLMAGQRPLKPSILVRVQAGHQMKNRHQAIFCLMLGKRDRTLFATAIRRRRAA